MEGAREGVGRKSETKEGVGRHQGGGGVP
jgi:hypothetical protein